MRMETEEERGEEGNFGNLIDVGIALGKKKLAEMIIGWEDWSVVGILGIDGSRKATLASEVFRDIQVASYFNNRILFLTLSKSPNVELLKTKIWSFVSGCDVGSHVSVQRWNLKVPWKAESRSLVVLAVVRQLICRFPGCKKPLVFRTNLPTVLDAVHEVDLLREDESISLFCHSSFWTKGHSSSRK